MAIDFSAITGKGGGPASQVDRADLNPRTYAGAGKRSLMMQRLQAANGRPAKMLEELAKVDPSSGGDFVTEAEVLSLLAGLGVVGLSIQPFYTWTDSLSDASEPISENVQIVPGMCVLIQLVSKGADVAAAGGIIYSSPTTLSSVKIGQSNVNNGHPIPFAAGAQPGTGRLIYEFTEQDGTGQTFTADANCLFATGTTGTWIGSLFRSKAACMAWLDLHRVN